MRPGLLVIFLYSSVLSTAVSAQEPAVPNFAPEGYIGWRAAGATFIPEPSGPQPVTQDKAYPRVLPGPERVADLTNPNLLPWVVLADTTVDRHARPTFAKYLKELDGKLVSLIGYMQPLSDDLEVASFMLIEYPVGCWYCETPAMTGIVLVELPPAVAQRRQSRCSRRRSAASALVRRACARTRCAVAPWRAPCARA